MKFFHLPTPRELGWSSDALGSRAFTPFQEGHTWEDWEEHVRAKYPIRYFLLETLPNTVWYPLRRFFKTTFYWLRCHLLPGSRYHLLDLRGVDPLPPAYTHGYLDPCTVMQLAAWAALRAYVAEGPSDPGVWGTPEELAGSLKDQKFFYDEAMELHEWWMHGRAVEQAKGDALYKAVDASVPAGKEAHEAATKAWLDYYRWMEEHEEEQFLRLCRIRRTLWT